MPNNKNYAITEDGAVLFTIPLSPIFHQKLQPCAYKHPNWDETHHTKTPPESRNNLTILTYNLWGAPQDSASEFFQLEKRSAEILKIIETINPDIICFQEVSRDWANILLKHPAIQEKYYSTDKNGDRVFGTFGLGQMTFSKFPIESIDVLGLPGFDIYTMLKTTINMGESSFDIVNVHLHSSKQHEAFRIAQLKTIFKELGKTPAPKNKIICGDFNFGDGEDWSENNHISQDFIDAWKELHKDNPGYTEDTDINKMRLALKGLPKHERFDKVLYQSSEEIKPIEIELVGTAPLEKDPHLWPSDHFGLLTRFNLMKNELKGSHQVEPTEQKSETSSLGFPCGIQFLEPDFQSVGPAPSPIVSSFSVAGASKTGLPSRSTSPN